MFSTNNNANFFIYLTVMNEEIIAFDLLHEKQITKLIERLQNTKCSGLHNISNILVKGLCYIFRLPLTILSVTYTGGSMKICLAYQ